MAWKKSYSSHNALLEIFEVGKFPVSGLGLPTLLSKKNKNGRAFALPHPAFEYRASLQNRSKGDLQEEHTSQTKLGSRR